MTIHLTTEIPTIPSDKRKLLTETANVWDSLVEEGYFPSDFSIGSISMTPQGFKKLTSKTNGKALIKETRYYRISCLWSGSVEISLTEVKCNNENGWALVEKWHPIC